MMVVGQLAGVVSTWDTENGEGLIRLDDGRLVWTHFSVIDAPTGTYKELTPGEFVYVVFSSTPHGDIELQAESVRRRQS